MKGLITPIKPWKNVSLLRFSGIIGKMSLSNVRDQPLLTMKRLFLSATFATICAMGSVQAEVNFAKDVLPILRDNCISCHGAKKKKGRLRLDTEAFAHKDSLIPGDLEGSELYQRVILPADDDDIMPPLDDGRKPLKKAEIEIIKNWIQEGGKYTGVDIITPAAEKPVEAAEVADKIDSSFDFNQDIRPILDSLSADQKTKLMAWIAKGAEMPQVKASEPQLVETEVSDAEKAAIAKLQSEGVLAMKVAQNVNWVQANFRLAGEAVKDENIAVLKDIKNLTDLDLSKTSVTDSGLAHLKDLTNITRLNLNNTAITDEGLSHLVGLKNLTYLNLYGTAVTDKGLAKLSKIQTLKKLYLWQTKVTDSGANALKSELPWIYINRGIELAALAPEPKKEEPKKEAAPKQAAKAPVEKKKPEPSSKAKGPSISDVILFLSQADAPQKAAPKAKAAVAKKKETQKSAEAKGPSISDVILFLSQADAPQKAAPKAKAAVAEKKETKKSAEAKAPSISDIILFLSKSEVAKDKAVSAKKKVKTKPTGLTIAEVVLSLN